MKKKLYAILAIVLAATIAGVAFAQTATTSTVSVSTAGVGGDFAAVTGAGDYVATQALKYGTVGDGTTQTTLADPSWTPIVDAAGDITAGDLYYIDTTGYTGDVIVTLYLDNPTELAKNYSYINMQINVWKLDGTSWAQATLADSSTIGTVYLTLSNGHVSFILDGGQEYTLAMDDGVFYCIDTDASGGSLSPAFFVDVRQA